MSEAATDTVTVHTSLRGLAAAYLSPLLLIALGTAAMSEAGARPVPVGFVAVGLALAAAVLLDFPHRIVFDRHGFRRVCPLRRPFVPWHRVSAIERTRPSAAGALHSLNTGHPTEPRVSGGLVARGRGHRRWMLTDQVESQDEYDRLQRLLESAGAPVRLRAVRPHAGATPTDLYRPRRHR